MVPFDNPMMQRRIKLLIGAGTALIGLAVVVFGLILFVTYSMVQRDSSYQMATAYLRTHPEVKATLGKNLKIRLIIHKGWQLRKDDQNGEAEFHFWVMGSNGAASARVAMLMTNGIWGISYADLQQSPNVAAKVLKNASEDPSPTGLQEQHDSFLYGVIFSLTVIGAMAWGIYAKTKVRAYVRHEKEFLPWWKVTLFKSSDQSAEGKELRREAILALIVFLLFIAFVISLSLIGKGM